KRNWKTARDSSSARSAIFASTQPHAKSHFRPYSIGSRTISASQTKRYWASLATTDLMTQRYCGRKSGSCVTSITTGASTNRVSDSALLTENKLGVASDKFLSHPVSDPFYV